MVGEEGARAVGEAVACEPQHLRAARVGGQEQVQIVDAAQQVPEAVVLGVKGNAAARFGHFFFFTSL